MLHAVAHAASARGFDRVAHRLDRAVPDGMRGHLQPSIGGSPDQRDELARRRTPQASTRAHHNALGAAVDEHLDRARAHDLATKACVHAKMRRRLEQLPRQEFVDAHVQLAIHREPLVAEKVVGEAAVDRGADRGDASRQKQLLREQDGLSAAPAIRQRLDIGDHPHRRLLQQAVRRPVRVVTDASAGRVRRRGSDAGRAQGGAVGDAGVTASFVDEGRARAGGFVKLQAVGRSPLGQRARAIAHALLPFARLEAAAVHTEPNDDVRHVRCRSQVRAEPGEAVIDDVRVRVVEPGQDCSAMQRHDPRTRASELHQPGPAGRQNAASRDCQVGACFQGATAQRAHDAAGQDQIRFHRADTVEPWPSTFVPTR